MDKFKHYNNFLSNKKLPDNFVREFLLHYSRSGSFCCIIAAINYSATLNSAICSNKERFSFTFS